MVLVIIMPVEAVVEVVKEQHPQPTVAVMVVMVVAVDIGEIQAAEQQVHLLLEADESNTKRVES